MAKLLQIVNRSLPAGARKLGESLGDAVDTIADFTPPPVSPKQAHDADVRCPADGSPSPGGEAQPGRLASCTRPGEKGRHYAWFAIRSLYLCSPKSDGTNIFEERVVVFEAATAGEAFEKAEAESEQYSRVHKFKEHPVKESYEQDGDPLIDGYEVWSVMLEARASLDEFYARRYAPYDYHPE
jgi:hypothetical protein